MCYFAGGNFHLLTSVNICAYICVYKSVGPLVTEASGVAVMKNWNKEAGTWSLNLEELIWVSPPSINSRGRGCKIHSTLRISHKLELISPFSPKILMAYCIDISIRQQR